MLPSFSICSFAVSTLARSSEFMSCGTATAARSPRMARTTSNSTSVKPRCRARFSDAIVTFHLLPSYASHRQAVRAEYGRQHRTDDGRHHQTQHDRDDGNQKRQRALEQPLRLVVEYVPCLDQHRIQLARLLS